VNFAKCFINWRVLSLVKINTRISDTPCILKKKKVTNSCLGIFGMFWYKYLCLITCPRSQGTLLVLIISLWYLFDIFQRLLFVFICGLVRWRFFVF
jgi:hypothetical protein